MMDGYQEDYDYLDEPEDMSELNEQPIPISHHDLGEHQKLVEAHRALIEQYFVDASQSAFYFVRSHQQQLNEWHYKHTKWHLEKYQGIFHLQLIPSVLPPVQNKYGLSHPCDFAYLFWILWYAAEGHARHYAHTQYFSLQDLLTQIQEQWQITDKYALLQLNTSKSRRQSLVRALRYLIQGHYLRQVHGQTEVWIETTNDDDQIYYSFTDLTSLLISSFQFNAVGLIKTRLHQLYEEVQPAYLYNADEPMTRVWRNLLLTPAFFRYDDPEAFSYLRKNASVVEKDLSYNFGWLLEVNGDYACVVHSSTDKSYNVTTFKLSSSIDQLTLLFCGALRAHIGNKTLSCNASGCILTSYEEFQSLFIPMYKDFVTHSSAQIGKKDVMQYFEEVCCKMREKTLIRGPDIAGQVLILPTAASYDPVYTQEVVKPDLKTKREKSPPSEYTQNSIIWNDDQE